MTDVFTAMSGLQKARFGAAYLDYLRARDGVPDLQAHQLDTRERRFAELDRVEVRWQGAPLVDQVVFDRNCGRGAPEAGLSEATLWALATAKANRGEQYGVEYAARHARSKPSLDDPHTYVMAEEFYHTRILRGVLKTVGIRMELGTPGLATRALVRMMVRLPEVLSDVVVLCGEVVGVAIFALLLQKARRLFSQQATVMARIEALLGQIMVDEVGHVHFVRSRLGRARLGLAKRLLPVVARSVLAELHEMELLFPRPNLIEVILAADVDGAAAPYPDRFILPATT